MDPKATVFAVIQQPTKKARSLVDEFEKFAFKGNVIDMAVGVIIGAAFHKIVDSLVKHIIMPTVNMLLPSESDYTELKWTIGEKSIPYGLFLGEIVNFLIIASVLFLFTVKFLGWIRRMRRHEEEKPAKEVAEDVKLLTEIRDLLKAKN